MCRFNAVINSVLDKSVPIGSLQKLPKGFKSMVFIRYNQQLRDDNDLALLWSVWCWIRAAVHHFPLLCFHIMTAKASASKLFLTDPLCTAVPVISSNPSTYHY